MERLIFLSLCIILGVFSYILLPGGLEDRYLIELRMS